MSATWRGTCAHVQKTMGKHLLNLKARNKGKLADGRPIGVTRRLSETKVKPLQKYYGPTICQNTIRRSNPTRRDVDVAVYAMKKMHHCNFPLQC